MDYLIDYTLKKKRKSGLQHKIQIMSLLHFSPISLTLIQLCISAHLLCLRKLLIRPVYVCVCLSFGRTALRLCFYIPTLLLLASVWGPISQLCWRSINPDRSIVPTFFTGSDQRLALRYHFQLEKHSWAGMEVDLKCGQKLTGKIIKFSLNTEKDWAEKDTFKLLSVSYLTQ